MTTEILLPPNKERRKLLPWWVKISIWYFMVIGLFICLVPIYLYLQFSSEIVIDYYGFRSNNPVSLTGLCVIAIALLNGLTALALWLGKPWAVKLAIFQGITCALILLINWVAKPYFTFSNLSYLLLIPYIYKMFMIRKDWESGA